MNKLSKSYAMIAVMLLMGLCLGDNVKFVLEAKETRLNMEIKKAYL